MADRPILFSAPMVRALLAGAKTQTRRLFKPRGFEFYTHPIGGDRYTQYRPYRDGTWDDSRVIGDGPMQAFGQREGLYGYVPYAVGDRLWVKETHTVGFDYDDDDKPIGEEPRVIYAATECPRWYDTDTDEWLDGPKWAPSIFMRRKASRLTLTVTDVRIERLQNISEADAVAEGLQHRMDWLPQYRGSDSLPWRSEFPRDAYHDLWNSINGAGAWEQNPWIVALTFDVEHRNIDN